MARFARWGVAVATVAAALAAVSSRAAAEPVDESGYWWRMQAVPGSPLAPPGVEPGGLYVAADALGPAAVSAVRASVASAEVDALVLVEAASSGAPELRACPTSGWTAPDGGGAGAFADRPSQEQCEVASVAGVRDDDGTWTFPVGSLVVAGVLDVVIVPGDASQSVTFDPPGDGAVVLAPPDETGAASPPVGDLRQPPSPPANTSLTDLGDDAPSAGFVVPPAGTPASALERDVDPFPAPALAASAPGEDGDGGRAPLALVAVAIPAAAWAYRTRRALAAAPGHVLAQPLRHRRDVLASVGATVAHEPEADAGGRQ